MPARSATRGPIACSLLACAVAALAGCPRNTGAGSSASGGGGDRWALPLVGALEDGLLITPVLISGQGPFLFLLDPDAPISVIDADLVKVVQLAASKGPDRVDESDSPQPRVYAQLSGLELGTLVLEQRDVMIARKGAFDIAGRRILGVLGRDVLFDRRVFGFDRDQGIATLVAASGFTPPPGATALVFEPLPSKVKAAPRQLVRATIGGEQFKLHVDLGAVPSQLREGLWERAKLVPRDVEAALIDEVGSARMVTKASDGAAVAVEGVTAERVVFVPYGDRRWLDQDIDGALGLGFFAGHSVWLDWGARTIYLDRRKPGVGLAARIGRWDAGPLGKCEHPGCVVPRIVDPLAGKPLEEGKPHPGVVLSVARDERAGGMDLEIMLEVQDRPELARLIVNMPAHIDRVIEHLGPQFVGAALTVVDVGPFPRTCPTQNGCVDHLAR